jgi:hypothetical protein
MLQAYRPLVSLALLLVTTYDKCHPGNEAGECAKHRQQHVDQGHVHGVAARSNQWLSEERPHGVLVQPAVGRHRMTR